MTRPEVKASVIVSLVVASSLISAPVWGQSIAGDSADRRSVVVRTGVRLETWTEDRSGPDGESLEQLGTFASTSVRLNPRVKLNFVTGWTSSEWGPGDNLAGLRDSKAQVSWRADRQLVLRLGVSLPTGRQNLSAEEVRIARGLADPTKAFAVNKVGEGFDVHIAAARSARIGALDVALAVSYLHKGRYDAVDGQGPYQPGNQWNVAASMNTGSGAIRWRNSIVFSTYGTDRLEESDAFQFGNRFRLESLLRGGASPVWQVRGRTVLQGANTSPGNLDLAARSEDQGAGWYIDGSFGFPASSNWSVFGMAGMRLIENDADGTGGGRRFDLGPMVRISLSSSARLDVRGRYSLGALDAGQQRNDIDISGFGMDATLVFWR